MAHLAAAVILAISLLFPLAAGAQESAETFPSRPITLVLPHAAGGPTDILARITADKLSSVLGQPVVVLNRVGGATSIAARSVATAPADGYTLYQVDISFAVARHVVSSYDVDPLTAFRSVGQTARSQLALMVSPNLGAVNLKEFLSLARKEPSKIKVAHTGLATPPQLAMVGFLSSEKLDLLEVPFRSIADATTMVINGEVSALFSAVATAASLYRNQQVRVLGVTGDDRQSAIPDVPTFKESGAKVLGFEKGAWFGIVAPSGTPETIVRKINEALNQVTNDADVRGRLTAIGMEPISNTPANFQELINTQYAEWRDLLRKIARTQPN